MKKILFILISILFIGGCTSTSDYKTLMENNDYVILDVRTKDEYDESHVIDAINIPFDEIDETIEIDKDKLIFVYCKSGNRSSIAYNTLTNLGYEVYDLGAFKDIDLDKE